MSITAPRRDPFGERPLYYCWNASGLQTATSIWTLLGRPTVPRALDRASLVAALCGGLQASASLFQGIRRVPPGHALHLESQGPRVVPYWVPPRESSPDTSTLAYTAAGLLRRLQEAVRARSNVAGAACALSGGIDSGALLALLSKETPVRAWTQVGDFLDEGERQGASLLARSFAAAHHTVEIAEADLPDHAPATIRACEHLVWNGGAVARHLFFKRLAAAGETEVFSGTGADEVLCGNPAALESLDARTGAESDLALSLLRPDSVRTLAPVTRAACAAGDLMCLQRRALDTVLPESTLPVECRTSSAEGLIVHLPYLDLGVADLALGAPMRMRVHEGMGKLLLREAVRGLLPEEIRSAPKRARLAPPGGMSQRARHRWLAFYDEWLSRPRLDALGIVETPRVRALFEDYCKTSGDERIIQDAVLMRLVSASVLWETVETLSAGMPSVDTEGCPPRA